MILTKYGIPFRLSTSTFEGCIPATAVISDNLYITPKSSHEILPPEKVDLTLVGQYMLRRPKEDAAEKFSQVTEECKTFFSIFEAVKSFKFPDDIRSRIKFLALIIKKILRTAMSYYPYKHIEAKGYKVVSNDNPLEIFIEEGAINTGFSGDVVFEDMTITVFFSPKAICGTFDGDNPAYIYDRYDHSAGALLETPGLSWSLDDDNVHCIIINTSAFYRNQLTEEVLNLLGVFGDLVVDYNKFGSVITNLYMSDICDVMVKFKIGTDGALSLDFDYLLMSEEYVSEKRNVILSLSEQKSVKALAISDEFSEKITSQPEEVQTAYADLQKALFGDSRDVQLVPITPFDLGNNTTLQLLMVTEKAGDISRLFRDIKIFLAGHNISLSNMEHVHLDNNFAKSGIKNVTISPEDIKAYLNDPRNALTDFNYVIEIARDPINLTKSASFLLYLGKRVAILEDVSSFSTPTSELLLKTDESLAIETEVGHLNLMDGTNTYVDSGLEIHFKNPNRHMILFIKLGSQNQGISDYALVDKALYNVGSFRGGHATDANTLPINWYTNSYENGVRQGKWIEENDNYSIHNVDFSQSLQDHYTVPNVQEDKIILSANGVYNDDEMSPNRGTTGFNIFDDKTSYINARNDIINRFKEFQITELILSQILRYSEMKRNEFGSNKGLYLHTYDGDASWTIVNETEGWYKYSFFAEDYYANALTDMLLTLLQPTNEIKSEYGLNYRLYRVPFSDNMFIGINKNAMQISNTKPNIIMFTQGDLISFNPHVVYVIESDFVLNQSDREIYLVSDSNGNVISLFYAILYSIVVANLNFGDLLNQIPDTLLEKASATLKLNIDRETMLNVNKISKARFIKSLLNVDLSLLDKICVASSKFISLANGQRDLASDLGGLLCLS